MSALVYEKKEKVDGYDKFCFWAILIDIFFLPYCSIISTSYSIPLIVLWFLMRGERTHKVTEYNYFPIAVFFMIVAVVMSTAYWGETLYETAFMTTVKRFIQYLTSFWYYFFFAYYIKRYKVELNKIVFFAIVYIAALALFYFLFREDYATLKVALHPADNHTRRWLAGVLYEYRYNFLWTDPNNVAYATTSLVLFYFSEDSQKDISKKLFIFVLWVFILVCTMSIGGITIGIISIVFYTIANSWNSRTSTIRVKTLVSVPIALVIGAIFLDKITGFLSSDVVESLLDRISFYENTSDITGGRLNDLVEAVKLLNPMFLFMGSGKEGFTHENGHIYLIAMYGLPAYLYFMYVLFRKRKLPFRKYIFVLPMFVGFTLNIAIIEQKFLLILMLLMAYYTAVMQNDEELSNYKQRRRR